MNSGRIRKGQKLRLGRHTKKNEWSWRSKMCLNCETTKIKHKGNGLCLRCSDKKRAENPERKKQLKKNQEKWYKKVKGTPEYKKLCLESVKKWQATNPRAHKRNWQTRNLRNGVRKFLLSNAKNKTMKGLILNINGKQIKTNIIPVHISKLHSEGDDTLWRIEIFKKVYEKLI